MNYKVLLVDDEVIELEWLKKRISWHEMNLEVVATAKTGFEALRILKEQNIDILITDIRMPIMSGLELAQKARELSKDIKIAFISGHGEFTYAKQAIRLGASGYVLKPVKNEELKELLLNIIEKLELERKQEPGHISLKDTIEVVKDKILMQWLEEGEEKNQNLGLLNKYGIIKEDTRGIVVILEIDDLNWKLNDYPELKRKEIIKKCMDTIVDFMNYEHINFYVYNGQGRMTILLAGYELQVAKYLMEKLSDKVRMNSMLTVTAGLGSYCDTPEKFPQSYENAKRALESKMFLGKDKIIYYGDIKEHEQEFFDNYNNSIKKIINSVLNYDIPSINDSISELFESLKWINTKKTLIGVMLLVISRLETEFQQRGSSIDTPLKDKDKIYSFETLEDIRSWLVKGLAFFSEQLAAENEKKDRKVIENIKKYVQQHVEEKITLKEVADHFSFSPNYLGHVFKEATGENFSDFLLKLRMQRACEYLSDHKMKIYEICDRIGYKNILYFNRQFKEYYGLTPSEYRKRNKV